MLSMTTVSPYLEKLKSKEATQADVARELDVTPQTLHNWLRRHKLIADVGVGRGGSNPSGPTPEMQAAVEEAIAVGSVLAVAKRRGVRYATLHAWVKKAQASMPTPV